MLERTRYRRFDRDKLLDLWADGESVERIAAAMGTLSNNAIVSAVAEARRAGDPRAVKRKTGWHESIKRGHERSKRLRLLRRFPGSDAEIKTAIANYSGPVNKLPTGWHMGHSPDCLKALN